MRDSNRFSLALALAGLALLGSCWTVAAADAYEPDNTAAQANAITTDGTRQEHEINPASDADFVSFPAPAGSRCTIVTSGAGPNPVIDTVITLYGSNGTTELATDDDGGDGYYSRLEHTFSSAGTYYLRVRSYNSAYSGGYYVSVTVTQTTVAQGQVTRGGNPVAGAAVWATSGGSGFEAPAGATLTDANGRYAIELPAGTYTVSAHLAGHTATPAQALVTVPGGTAANFALTAGTRPADGVRTSHALLIGISDYVGNAMDLSYCDRDAQEFAASLVAGGNWEAPNIALLLNRKANAAAIRAGLHRMATLADADDQCLFFFSGHGGQAPDRAPYDESDGLDEYLVETDDQANIYDDDLGEWVTDLPTQRVMVVLAACHSGGFIKSAGAGPRMDAASFVAGFNEDLQRAIEQKRKMAPLDLDDNGFGVVITAADDDETCQESYELQHDVLVYYVLQGMAGPADRDSNGWVSAEELFAWAGPRATSYNSSQHAQLYDANPASAFNFLDLGAAPPTLAGDFGSGAQMVSIPGTVLTGAGIRASLGAAEVATWNAATQQYGSGDPAPAAGTGCWARFAADAHVRLTCETLRQDSFTWNLRTGWNLIGAPWSEAVAMAGLTSNPAGSCAPLAWNYWNGSYSMIAAGTAAIPGAGTNFLPWRSYWLYASEDCTATLNGSVATADADAAAADADGWAIAIVASSASGSDAAAVCGVRAEALSVPDVPAASGGPSLAIAGSGVAPLTVDLRGEGAARQEWALSVAARVGEEVTVTWPDLSTLPRDYRALLIDRATNATTSMRTATGYRFTAGEGERMLLLRVEPRGGLLALHALHARQTGAAAAVSFTLSAPAEVDAEIINIAGRGVRTLALGRAMEEGQASVAWDLRSSAGTAVPTGRYLVRVTARSEAGESVQAIAPLQVRR